MTRHWPLQRPCWTERTTRSHAGYASCWCSGLAHSSACSIPRKHWQVGLATHTTLTGWPGHTQHWQVGKIGCNIKHQVIRQRHNNWSTALPICPAIFPLGFRITSSKEYFHWPCLWNPWEGIYIYIHLCIYIYMCCCIHIIILLYSSTSQHTTFLFHLPEELHRRAKIWTPHFLIIT